MKRIFYYILNVLFVYLLVGAMLKQVQERFLFHPDKLPDNYTFSFDHDFTEHFFNTPFKGRINALHFTVDNPKGVVLYSHGNAGALDRWGMLHAPFTSRGYDVLIYDYRGFGKSKGKRSEKNMHSDARFLLAYLAKRYAMDQIIIYGRSMGSGVSVPLAADNPLKALILETPYYSIADVAQSYLPAWPVKRLLSYRFENGKRIAEVSAPITILHGTRDGIVPYQSAVKLAEAGGDTVNFITFQDGGHSNLASFPAYDAFLDSTLGPRLQAVH